MHSPPITYDSYSSEGAIIQLTPQQQQLHVVVSHLYGLPAKMSCTCSPFTSQSEPVQLRLASTSGDPCHCLNLWFSQATTLTHNCFLFVVFWSHDLNAQHMIVLYLWLSEATTLTQNTWLFSQCWVRASLIHKILKTKASFKEVWLDAGYSKANIGQYKNFKGTLICMPKFQRNPNMYAKISKEP